MFLALAVLPWILTVAALLFIIVRNNNQENFLLEEDDFILDDDKEIVRVAVYEDKAYWVYENVFYESEVTREPDFSTAQPIDTMSLSAKELDKLMEILDEIENHGKE
jgi:hypothetical protein